MYVNYGFTINKKNKTLSTEMTLRKNLLAMRSPLEFSSKNGKRCFKSAWPASCCDVLLLLAYASDLSPFELKFTILFLRKKNHVFKKQRSWLSDCLRLWVERIRSLVEFKGDHNEYNSYNKKNKERWQIQLCACCTLDITSIVSLRHNIVLFENFFLI